MAFILDFLEHPEPFPFHPKLQVLKVDSHNMQITFNVIEITSRFALREWISCY